MRRPEPAAILARLAGYAKLDRPATDEVGWIAYAYGIKRAQAKKWITVARVYQDARAQGGAA